MWNGLWKLTAMVGVIGIGLFAAYQAQKGMKLTVASAPSDPGAGNTDSDEASSLTDETPPAVRSFTQQEPALLAEVDLEPTKRPLPRQQKKAAQEDVDLLDDFAKDPPQVKKVVASKKVSGSVIPVKRTQRQPGVDFREGVEGGDDQGRAAVEPQRLPEEESPAIASMKKSGKAIRQVSAESTDGAPATLEAEIDPFADEAAANPISGPAASNPLATKTESEFGDEIEPKTNSVPVKETADPLDVETPSQAPGRARLSTDFGTTADPPRSKRAKQNAGKRVEPPTDTGANPFGTDSPSIAAPASRQAPELPSANQNRDDVQNFPLDSKSKVANQIRAMERYKAEEEKDELDIARPKSEDSTDSTSRPSSAPRSLPPDPLLNSLDDASLVRSNPNRSRTPMPAQLPDDQPNAGFLSESPPKSRDPQSRRTNYDSVTPVDMVGDGVVGDASQQGLQQPRLTIEKIVKQQAVLEQPLIYTIIVKNIGTVDAHNVVIEDRIPKGTELQGTSPQAELSGKRLIWNHLLLKPNEEKKISIKVIPKQEGPIGSVARVYFATEVSAEIVVAAPQLEFTVKCPSEVRYGQHFEMIFNLKNVGTVDASNIIVRDLVPDQLKHEAGTDIECPIGKMAPQEVREIVLPVTAIKTGTVVNKAILTADSGVKKSLDSSIDIIGEVLVLTRTGQSRLYVERSAEFTNNIRNDGNQRADRIKVSEVVPAGMEFEAASDGGKYDANLRAVVWTVGPLAPGNDKSLKVKFVPRETGTLAAKITATGSAGSTAAIQSAIEVIGKPELQMETLSATGAVTVGDRITSKFQLSNTGTAAASNVQLRVKLPRELRLISVKGAKFQQKDDYIQFETLGELAPRSKAAYELVLEPISEADAQIGLEISADHLPKPGRRVETIQIARDALK